MALTAASIFEVRTTGADTQGGCFDSTIANAGSDLSQQDAAALSLTDVVTNGTTTVTSATGGFLASHIGNGFNIAGTIYQITARASSTSVTVDRTAASATGQTGKVGGALATPGKAGGAHAGQNVVYIKYSATPYAVSSATSNVAGGRVTPVAGVMASFTTFVGYDTTRTVDNTDANRPTLQCTAAMGDAFVLAGANAFSLFRNLIVDGNGQTGVGGIQQASVSLASRCRVTKASSNINATSGLSVAHAGALAHECELLACTGVRSLDVSSGKAVQCVVSGHTGAQPLIVGEGAVLEGSLVVNCTAATSALLFTGHGEMRRVTFYNVTNAVDLQSNAALVQDCLFSTCGAKAIKNAALVRAAQVMNCAFHSVTSGNDQSNVGLWLNNVTLTADPFVNAAGGNFGLNSVAGGGAACKAAGLGTFPGLSSTVGYPDIGAAQSQSSGGGLLFGANWEGGYE